MLNKADNSHNEEEGLTIDQRKVFSRRQILTVILGLGGLAIAHGSIVAQKRTPKPASKNIRTMSTPEENFKQLRLELPPTPTPRGVYRPYVIVGNLLYVAGHGPYLKDGSVMKGKVGSDVDIETGIKAAEQTGLAILATLRSAVGSLNKIKRVVKILGMVNCVDSFEDHPKVINGCSDLFAKIWGDENGVAVRSSVGMNSLPINISVEIEAVFELA